MRIRLLAVPSALLAAGLAATALAEPCQPIPPGAGHVPPEDVRFAAGCGPTCLPPPFLPAGTLVVDGVAYFGQSFLGCDEDRPVNQQLQWVNHNLWYYYAPAHVCAPAP